MAAPESTKFQINYKLADGTLINVYAISQGELEASLTSIADLSTLITTTGASLGATPQSFSSSNAISYAKKALGGTTVVSDENGGEQMTDKYGCVWTYGRSDAPDCINGKMVHKTGVKKDGSPFWGWYDPAAGPKPVRMAPGYTKVDSIHPDSPSRYKK
jgi:hypothetical protein